jgi:hypothetical protein
MEEEDGDDEEEEEEEEEDEEEQQLLGEFEKELEGMLLPSNRERLRSEVKAGMERELENIIQEVSNPHCGCHGARAPDGRVINGEVKERTTVGSPVDHVPVSLSLL